MALSDPPSIVPALVTACNGALMAPMVAVASLVMVTLTYDELSPEIATPPVP